MRDNAFECLKKCPVGQEKPTGHLEFTGKGIQRIHRMQLRKNDVSHLWNRGELVAQTGDCNRTGRGTDWIAVDIGCAAIRGDSIYLWQQGEECDRRRGRKYCHGWKNYGLCFRRTIP